MEKIIRWTLLLVVLIIFASGGIALYTVFFNELKVPSLKNLSIVEAVYEAEKSGLIVQVEHTASTLPKGRVLAQYPEVGSQIRKGQVIVLQVSKGGELHTVPDLRGQSIADAQKLIKEQGFSVGDIVKIKEPDYEPGIVIAQSPSAPANISYGRKIDLLIQDGVIKNTNTDTLKVPDVNRMSEKDAREALNASGIKVQAIDRVYSPLLPEGVAIETKPAAGTSITANQGVILKLSTQRRPAGFIDANSQNPNVRRVTNQPPNQQNQQNQQTNTQITKSQNNIQNTQHDTDTSNTNNNNINNITEDFANAPEKYAPSATSRTSTNTSRNTANNQTQQTQSQNTSGYQKNARVRYIVPPLAAPMNLRIEVTEPTGRRDVFNRQVKSGESINTQVGYNQECVVTIYLGGQSVWQERHR